MEILMNDIMKEIESTDKVMNQTFWVGVYPGLSQEMLDYVVKQLEAYFHMRSG